MNVYYTYGRVKGDSKKDEQTIYVRLFYGRNKIQVKASTQLTIRKHGWNFKKGEDADVVDLGKKQIPPHDLENFKNNKQKLSDIRVHLKNEFRKLMLSREHNSFTQIQWNDWARTQLGTALLQEQMQNESAGKILRKREDIRRIESSSSINLDAKTPEGPIDVNQRPGTLGQDL